MNEKKTETAHKNIIAGGRDTLREAAKQLRTHGDNGHAALCDLHADDMTTVIDGCAGLCDRYTVILSYPNYIGDYGQEYYTAWTTGETWEQAIAEARRKAVDAQEPDTVNDPEDFALVGYFRGHQTMKAPGS